MADSMSKEEALEIENTELRYQLAMANNACAQAARQKTLPDEFAMAALPAFIASMKASDLPREAKESLPALGEHLAKLCFAIAHAMMAERSKQKTPS